MKAALRRPDLCELLELVVEGGAIWNSQIRPADVSMKGKFSYTESICKSRMACESAIQSVSPVCCNAPNYKPQEFKAVIHFRAPNPQTWQFMHAWYASTTGINQQRSHTSCT